MSLKDEVQGTSRRGIQHAFMQLNKEDSKELAEMLLDESIEASAIARALRGRGYNVSDRSAQRYRRQLQEESDGS